MLFIDLCSNNRKNIFTCFFLFTVLTVFPYNVSACRTCTIPLLGKGESPIASESQNKKWFFEYLFEQKNWKEMDAQDAHQLHHQGHHFHDKITEDFHHFKLGNHISEQIMLFAEIPYVTIRSIEVDDHDILGSQQTSKGVGDMHLIAECRFLKAENTSLSLTGGAKFPVGETREKNSAGTQFEPELQPGSGSFDYILGGIYRQKMGRIDVLGNMTYVLATKGAQAFEFGDVFSSSLFMDYLLNFHNENLAVKVGIDATFQYEQKQKQDGVKIADSGGGQLLMGHSLKIEMNKRIAIFGSVGFPVNQDLGGVHQRLELEWRGGGRFLW